MTEDPAASGDEKDFARRVARAMKFATIGNVIGKGVAMVAIFVIVGLMTEDEFGAGGLVLSFLVVARAITEASLGVALVQVKNATRDQIDSLFWLSSAITFAAYGIIALGVAPLLQLVFSDFAGFDDQVRVVSLSLVLFTLFFVPRSLMERDLQFGRLTATENGSLIVGSAVGIILAQRGYGPWAFVWMEVSARACQAVTSIMVRPYVPRLHYRFTEIRAMFRFSLFASGSRILYNFYTYADYFIVARVFGQAALGLYTFAYRLVADPVKQLAMAVNQVAYPTLARLQDDPERLRSYFFGIARVSLSLIGSVLVVVVVYAEPVLNALSTSTFPQYGEYLEVIPIVWIFAAVGLLQAVGPLTPQLLNAVGQSRLNFYYSLLCAIALPIGFLIGAQFGIMGVAIAWLIGYPVVILVLFYFGSLALEIRPLQMLRVFAGLTVVLPSFAIAMAIRWGLRQAGATPMIVAAVGGSLTLFVAVAAVYFRERSTIAALRGDGGFEAN